MNVKALSKFLLALSVLLIAVSCEKEAIQLEESPADAAVEFRTDHCDAVIDFEGLDAGSIIGIISKDNGISSSEDFGTVSVLGKAEKQDGTLWPGNQAMVYYADQAPPPPPPTGNDDDLLGGDGNVAILYEGDIDSDTEGPDDNRYGGTFYFDFSSFATGSVGIAEFTAIDTEEPVGGPAGAASGSWTATGTFGTLSGEIPSVTNGDVQIVPVGIGNGIETFKVFLRGSGAIDNICLSVEEEDEDPGCTRTQGYWKTHSEYGPAPYDNTWAQLDDGADTDFFESGQSWYEVFHTPPRGNAYYNLAHQYMAAKLNKLFGADISAVEEELEEAMGLFEAYTPDDIGSLRGNDPVRKRFLYLAEKLDKYNNGLIGPGKCD